MIVLVSSSALPTPVQLKVKRVIGNSVWVGLPDKGIQHRENMSAYLVADSAAIWADEQTKPNVSSDDQRMATFEHEPVNARRTIGVDELGRPWGIDNPMPTTATIDVESLEVSVALDAFAKVPADNAIAVGTEDGTQTGTKHAHKIGADGKLEVKDTDAKTTLDAINAKLANPMPVTGPLTDTQLRASPVPVTGTVAVTGAGDATAANQVTANTILTAIATQLISGVLKTDDDETQTLLTSILTQLGAGGIIIGTENGTPAGVQHVFVNNLYNNIREAKDMVEDYNYTLVGNKYRLDSIEYTSATFPGVTATRSFTWADFGTKNERITNRTKTLT
jgi:hypothetical protein